MNGNAPKSKPAAGPASSAETLAATRKAIELAAKMIQRVDKKNLDKPSTYRLIDKLLKRMRINVKSPLVQKILAEEGQPIYFRAIAAKLSKDKTVLSNLAKSPNELIVNQLLWNNDCPTSVLSQIALNIKSYKQPFHRTLSMILGHRNVTPVLKRALFEKYKKEIAKNFQAVYRLVGPGYIASTPQDVLSSLAYMKLPKMRYYLNIAEYEKTPSKVLHYLSGLTTRDFKHLEGGKSNIIAELRIAIAKNKNASNSTVELLCSDGNVDVQVAAVSNPKVRERYLREILNNPDSPQKVKKAIKKALIKRGLEAPSATT